MRTSAGLAVAVSVCAVLGLAAAPAAEADDVNLLESHGTVALGTFINGSKLKIRLDGESGETGSEVDWDNTFGDDDETRFRLDGLWRFAERHYLRFLYTDYSRSKTATFDEDVEWGGETIPVGAEVSAKLGFEIIELAYEYAFLKRESYELAAAIGLHYTAFDASLRASVEVPGGGGTEERGGTASVDAPLPVIGLHGLWKIGGNFYLDGMAQFFALSIDEYDGNITNYRAALIWQPKKYVGLGVGYDYFKVDVDVEKDKFTGSMDWEYAGPQIFFNASF
ncbi:MAG: hypothetical protein MUC71_09380 [Steroidobacteraceae bacterium]|jgi:hypothetical protein|nr:hypothetical protein [Steroidobacteraceae bacterium]